MGNYVVFTGTKSGRRNFINSWTRPLSQSETTLTFIQFLSHNMLYYLTRGSIPSSFSDHGALFYRTTKNQPSQSPRTSLMILQDGFGADGITDITHEYSFKLEGQGTNDLVKKRIVCRWNRMIRRSINNNNASNTLGLCNGAGCRGSHVNDNLRIRNCFTCRQTTAIRVPDKTVRSEMITLSIACPQELNRQWH